MPEVLVDGLKFPEGPRWKDGKLWFSDLQTHRITTVDLSGKANVFAELGPDSGPSGLGFLTNGSLISTSRSKQLLKFNADGSHSIYADLEGLGFNSFNDMVVDGRGNAYVDSNAANFFHSGLTLVREDGHVAKVADKMVAPNGAVVTPDNKTLIVAETHARRISMWDILDDGHLANRRSFADTVDAHPDGICLDAEGAVWIGAIWSGVFRRVLPGGRVAQEIRLQDGRWAVACALGGPDRRTLFMATSYAALVSHEAFIQNPSKGILDVKSGFIEIAQVEVPGAGWP